MNTKRYEITCHECASTWSVMCESVIHAQHEEKAKEAIMEGAFFTRKCSHCGALITFHYPFLYCDPKLRLLIAFDDGQGKWIRALNEIAQYKQFTKRIVHTEMELREKIAVFEHSLSDESVSLMKQKLKDRYTHFHFDSEQNDVLWFISDKGPIGVEKRFYVPCDVPKGDFQYIE